MNLPNVNTALPFPAYLHRLMKTSFDMARLIGSFFGVSNVPQFVDSISEHTLTLLFPTLASTPNEHMLRQLDYSNPLASNPSELLYHFSFPLRLTAVD